MTKIIIFFFLSFASLAGSAQYGQYYNKPSSATDSVVLNILFTKNCLGSFQRQHQDGVLVALIGASVAAGSFGALALSPDLSAAGGKNILTIAGVLGSIAALAGVIVQIDSFKWLKRSSLQPVFEPYRAGVLLKF
jgi:hypothetical protein